MAARLRVQPEVNHRPYNRNNSNLRDFSTEITILHIWHYMTSRSFGWPSNKHTQWFVCAALERHFIPQEEATYNCKKSKMCIQTVPITYNNDQVPKVRQSRVILSLRWVGNSERLSRKESCLWYSHTLHETVGGGLGTLLNIEYYTQTWCMYIWQPKPRPITYMIIN